MALRLVSRRVSSLATRSFSKRHIATVSSSMTRPSLDRLVAVCEHPLFGSRIQKLHIVAGRINPEFVEYLTYTTKDQTEDRELALEQHADAKVVLQCAFNRSMKESRMETSGKATELLSRAFAAVKIYNTPVTLQVTSNPWADWEPVRHLDWHRDDTSGFNLKPALEFTIQPCLDAMANSKMHFTGLNLLVNDDMDTQDELVVFRSFDLEGYFEEDLSVFSGLKSVAFEAPEMLNPVALDSMTRIFSLAKSAETISFAQDNLFEKVSGDRYRCIWPERFDISDKILRSIQSDCITALEFKAMPISKTLLSDLLNKHKDTLESVVMWKIGFREGSWIEVLSWMKRNLPCLEKIYLRDLFHALRLRNSTLYTTHDPDIRGTISSVIGRKKVQAAFQTMIERPLLDSKVAYQEIMGR